MRNLLLLAALCLLTACAGSTRSAARIELPELPDDLATCAPLKSVSGRIVEATEVDTDRMQVLWAEDRAVAAKCIRRHEKIVAYYDELRANLKRQTGIVPVSVAFR